MNDSEAINFLKIVFEAIEDSKSLDDLNSIMENIIKQKVPDKFIINDEKYPKIPFEISKEDVENINLSEDKNFIDHISSQIKTPLEKLFYAAAWKQGDLGKYKHIIKGILDARITDSAHTQALTFYQFGKYLSDRKNQPIIDQHVIRAFKLHKYDGNDAEVTFKIRKIEELTPKHTKDITEYKNWIIKLSNKFPEDKEEFLFKVDRILMALGKVIKVKRK